jgi:peptide chain release factor 2
MEGVRKLEADVSDALELIELAEADGDAAMVAEATASLRALAEEAKRREIESLLSGEADANDCYLELNSGAGGTEAQDWAEMLMRMYLRWAEKHGYKTSCWKRARANRPASSRRRCRSAAPTPMAG